jgi:hypothetical protein
MLHRPGMPDPCQREVVNSYAMGIVDIGACAVQFVNRARDQNARRIAALDHYVEGWAEADVDKIFDATAPSYRFTDPLVGSFSGRLLHEYFDILQCRFSRAGTITKHELAFFLRGPLEGRSNGRDLRFWREAPLIGLTGVAEVEIGERGVIAERVAYDSNLASNTLRPTCTHRSDMNSNFSRIGGVSNNN